MVVVGLWIVDKERLLQLTADKLTPIIPQLNVPLWIVAEASGYVSPMFTSFSTVINSLAVGYQHGYSQPLAPNLGKQGRDAVIGLAILSHLGLDLIYGMHHCGVVTITELLANGGKT